MVLGAGVRDLTQSIRIGIQRKPIVGSGIEKGREQRPGRGNCSVSLCMAGTMPTVDTLRLGEGISGPLLEAAATPSGGEAKEVRVGQHPQRGHCTLAGGATTYVPCTVGGMA